MCNVKPLGKSFNTFTYGTNRLYHIEKLIAIAFLKNNKLN